MGDVAMIAPVLRQASIQNPDVEFSIATRAFFTPFFNGIEGVRVIASDIDKRYRGIGGIFKLYRDIRHEGPFDYLIDLHDVLRTRFLRVLFRFSGSHVFRIDKGRKEKKALTRKKNKKFAQLKTTIDRYADTFRKAGIKLDLDYHPPRTQSEIPDSIRAIFPEKKGKWIGIAPFAKHKGKIYPIDQMESVIATLSKEENLSIFLFGGGKEERTITERWATLYPHTFSVIGKISLQEEINLISNLDCMVSMDSSAMHMASLSGTRVVSIWGATHPYAGFLGFGQNTEDAVGLLLDCRPCSVYGNKPCYKGTWECLTLLSPQQIIDKISEK